MTAEKAMPTAEHATCGAASDHGEHGDQRSPSVYEAALRKKIQQQAIELSSYRSHVAWSSELARCCEEHTRSLHPCAADITNVMHKGRRIRSCSPSRKCMAVDKNPPHVISMIARHRQQVAELMTESNNLEKQVDVARRKAAEWRKSSIDLRKLLEKRDKENAILHMRSSKLQHVANAAEDQVIKQADTIRRLEICVELFEDGKAPAKVAEQHIAMKAMQTELHLKEQQLQHVLHLILLSHPELHDNKQSCGVDGMDGESWDVVCVVKNLLSIAKRHVATQSGNATLMQSEEDARIKELDSKVQQLQQERDVLLDHIAQEQARVSIKTHEKLWSQGRLGASEQDVSDDRCTLRASRTTGPPAETSAPQGVGDRDLSPWSDSGGRDAKELKKALALLRSIKSVIEDMPDGGAQLFESLSARLQLLENENRRESGLSSDQVSDGSIVEDVDFDTLVSGINSACQRALVAASSARFGDEPLGTSQVASRHGDTQNSETSRSELEDDLRTAQQRLEELESEIVVLRAERAEGKEEVGSLRLELDACRGANAAAVEHSPPGDSPRIASMQQSLQRQQEEARGLEAAVELAHDALLKLHAEVDELRKQWRESMRDAAASRNAAEQVLQKAEADYQELSRAFEHAANENAMVPGLVEELKAYKALAQSRDGPEGRQRLLLHPNLSCQSRQQKCVNALPRPALKNADLVTPEMRISRAHATNRREQSTSNQAHAAGHSGVPALQQEQALASETMRMVLDKLMLWDM